MNWQKSIETPSLCLECDGLTTKDFFVPPFRIRAGQTLCLHILWPSPAYYEDMRPILIGGRAHPSLRFSATVAYLDRPMPRRRWWGGLYNPSARNWLITERGLTSTEAEIVLGRVDVPADLSIGRIGWNERTMLDLEAYLLRPPDLLVFDTTGNDLLTTQYVFERLSSRSPSLALIYLKTRQRTDDPCLPDSIYLELVRATLQATTVE